MGKKHFSLSLPNLIADRCEAQTAAGRQCNHTGSIVLLGVRLCSQHADPARAEDLAEAKRKRTERTMELRQSAKVRAPAEPQEAKSERKKRRRQRPAPHGEAEMLEELKRQVQAGEIAPIAPRYGLHRRLRDRER